MMTYKISKVVEMNISCCIATSLKTTQTQTQTQRQR